MLQIQPRHPDRCRGFLLLSLLDEDFEIDRVDSEAFAPANADKRKIARVQQGIDIGLGATAHFGSFLHREQAADGRPLSSVIESARATAHAIQGD